MEVVNGLVRPPPPPYAHFAPLHSIAVNKILLEFYLNFKYMVLIFFVLMFYMDFLYGNIHFSLKKKYMSLWSWWLTDTAKMMRRFANKDSVDQLKQKGI